MKRVLMLILLLLVMTAQAFAAATTETAVFLIKSRPAVTLLEPVRAVIGPDGRASAFHDRLIVNASKQDIAAAKRLIAEIDRPPRRLIIEVRQHGGVELSSQGIGYGASSDKLRLGQRPPRDGVGIGIRSAHTRGSNDSLQRIRALDGRPALIRTGLSTPVYQTNQQIIGNRITQGFEVHYRDTHTGFHALPRVHGDQVTLEIFQQAERPMDGGRFMSQQASTVLSGQLGEWMMLGKTGGSTGDRKNDIGRHVRTRRSEEQTIELRVLGVD